MSISYHKNALVNKHESVGRWLIFHVLYYEYFDETTVVGYQQPACLCITIEFVVGTFCFHVNCIHCRGAVFVHVVSAQFCTEDGVSFYMCSALQVAWLALNIRHSSTRV